MAISSPGIGSSLDVNSIVSQLMAVEAQPLTTLARKESALQAKIAAFGSLNGGLAGFQSSLGTLTSPTKFQALSAKVKDDTVFSATADAKATPGTYAVDVLQLAQAQTLRSDGRASTSAAIGAGTSTTLTFQFGTISGGSYVKSGVALSNTVATSGIAAGSLTINGSAIATNGATTSAKALAAAINLKTGTTGVTATAAPTSTAALGVFADATTGVGDTYSLSVNGVNLAVLGDSSTLSAADLDLALADNAPGAVGTNLAAAGITFSGTAAGGDLVFTKADGANVSITQTLGGSATGGFAGLTSGLAQVTTSTISMASDTGFSIGGANPGFAGLTAGSALSSGAGFVQDGAQASGSVTIDSTNNSLQGIRDAINKGKLGVTASIVSDGSANPYHLVLTSNKTGATSSMKIEVSGDATLEGLLAYDSTDIAGQKLTQSTSGQDTLLTVNGIAISSSTSSVSEAIQGVTLNVAKTGSTSLAITRDTGSITASVNAFVKAYNDLNTSLRSLTAYDPATKTGGALLGDATARSVQTGLRSMLTAPIPELAANGLKNLTDIGITFQKDGSLQVNSGTLQSAITNNIDEIAGLFSAIGTTTDSLVSYTSSTSATKPGNYAVELTQAATKGNVLGNVALNAGSTIIQPNSTLNVTLDGKSSLVNLVAGTFTGEQLATMLQSAINGTSAFSGLGSNVKATLDGSGYLNITSNRYGSASKLVIASGTNVNAEDLLGLTPTTTDGLDVVGTIGGYAATGSGQTLTGANGSPAAGLKLTVADNASGGSVSFARGYAFQLNNLITSYLDSAGLVASKTKGLNASVTDIGKTRDSINAKLAATEKRYRAQFTALDTSISKMTSTSNYLTQQLASLAKMSSE